MMSVVASMVERMKVPVTYVNITQLGIVPALEKKTWIFYSGSFWRKKGFPEIGNFEDYGIEIGIEIGYP